MMILIADFDLFETVGGGKTFYRSIIREHPNVEFFYLTVYERPKAARPANAHPIPLQTRYHPETYSHYRDITPPSWAVHAHVLAANIAASVAGRRFDVVDLPDYYQFGMFIRPALRRHRVRFDRIALSLHGTASAGLALDWGRDGEVDRQLALQERLQFESADVRYGFNSSYLDEWRGLCPLEVQYINPLRYLPRPAPFDARAAAEPPALTFIGRTDKHKGPDLFLELAWWLPRESYASATIVGPESFDPNGRSSTAYLRDMAGLRLPADQVRMLPARTPLQLDDVFRSRSLTVVPAKLDRLNVVALESLLRGCPTAISTKAGACHVLESLLPGVPFAKIDVDNIYRSVPELLDILTNYDEYRRRLAAAVRAAQPVIDGQTMLEVYSSQPASSAVVRAEMDDWEHCLANVRPAALGMVPALKSGAKRVARQVLSPEALARAKALRGELRRAGPRGFVKALLKAKWHTLGQLSHAVTGRSSRLKNSLKSGDVLMNARRLVDRYQHVRLLSEHSDTHLEEKVRACGKLISDLRVDRVRLWREMARLEKLRGQNLVSAAYRLRAMRMSGSDLFGDLPAVTETLCAQGLEREAAAASAMYGSHPDREGQCTRILEAAFESCRQPVDLPWEMIDDRRPAGEFKTSIIVSLYNAADKLETFLNALSLQTMFGRQQAELILIDSGSPDCEYMTFQRIQERLQLPVVYARSPKRETIQCAWNRAIGLSRAPYLTFLGVDEAILPRCLEVLSHELDSDAGLDWVQGNALVTNVTRTGQWHSDVMLYDRAGCDQSYVYLETCYLGHVASLYRRSIHDRVGMYDPTYTAAGDNEFKNRVLPFIRTKTIPETLGVFRNYPCERASGGARAEIEDLRAWYLHRTSAGVRYAFARRDPADAESLLHAALRYRKSFCRHISTDVEYADHLASFLEGAHPNTAARPYFAGIRELLRHYRAVDLIPSLSAGRLRKAMWKTLRAAKRVADEHQKTAGQEFDPVYQLFNDNRHEQHYWVWPTFA